MRTVGFMLAALLASTLAAPGWAEQTNPVHVLIIDETQTLVESFQVNALIHLARQMPNLAVEARFVQVESSFQNPLPQPAAQRYDLIVVVPKTLAELKALWLMSRNLSELSVNVLAAFRSLKSLIERIFEPERGQPLDITQDIGVAFFAAIFQKRGWL